MLRRLICAILVLCLAAVTSIPVCAEDGRFALDDDMTLSATSAYVVFLGSDTPHDTVLYSQNDTEPIAPAGLVRVLMGLHAYKLMEEKNLKPSIAPVTFTEQLKDANFNATAGTGLPVAELAVGDTWTMEDLLSVAMVAAGSETVTMLTHELAGSDEAFVEGMNKLAKELGCTNTNVTNPYGLDDPMQYTCAKDMYIVLRYAMLNYPELTELMSYNGYVVKPLQGAEKSGASTNELLRPYSPHFYVKTMFGRSGFTESAGGSLAAVAKLEGFDVMTIVMGCNPAEEPRSAAFADTIALFDWAEDTFTYQSIIRKNQPIQRVGVDLAWNTDTVALVAKQDVNAVMRLDTELTALSYDITVDESLLNDDGNLTAAVDTDTVIASAKVFDGETLLTEVPLYAAKQIPRSQLLAALDTIWTVLSSPLVLIALAVLVVLFVAYVAISVMHNNSRKKKNQKKIKRY